MQVIFCFKKRTAISDSINQTSFASKADLFVLIGFCHSTALEITYSSLLWACHKFMLSSFSVKESLKTNILYLDPCYLATTASPFCPIIENRIFGEFYNFYLSTYLLTYFIFQNRNTTANFRMQYPNVVNNSLVRCTFTWFKFDLVLLQYFFKCLSF